METASAILGRAQRPEPPHATAADIAEFRSHAERARPFTTRPRVALLRRIARDVPELYRAVAHYGPGVRKRDGVGLGTQFARAVREFARGTFPAEFYLYRLYLQEKHAGSGRHFGFSRVLRMQEFLIEGYASPDYRIVAEKHLFAARCRDLGLPTVPILAEFAGGETVRHVQMLPPGDLFSKPSDLMIGLGVAAWRWDAQRGGYEHPENGSILTEDDLCRTLAQDSREEGRLGKFRRILLQSRLANHSAVLGRLTTGGLSTLRLVSCRSPSGAIDLLPPVIRMPIGEAIADNIAQGGLAAPIDAASGQIAGPGVRKDKTYGLSVFDRHPTTGTVLKGFQLPFWTEATELALAAHRAFPSLYFIGWDIALLEQGPVLLEANAWWDVDLTLLPHGITLADTQFMPYYNHYARRVHRNPDGKLTLVTDTAAAADRAGGPI